MKLKHLLNNHCHINDERMFFGAHKFQRIVVRTSNSYRIDDWVKVILRMMSPAITLFAHQVNCILSETYNYTGSDY